ncbi:MAG: GNAT family N-acetyltransferase [Steroidobacterales bacterium]
MKTAIQHDEGSGVFFADVDGHRAVLEYRRAGDTLTILHTGVPEAIGGRGIAAELTRAALEFARLRAYRVQPRCSYAAAFMRRHPEYAELIAR